MFLLMNHEATGILRSLAELTRRRYLGGEPLSDLIMVIMLVAAVASALIMLFWPRFEAPKHQLVVRQYFGHPNATPEREPAFPLLRIPILRYLLTAIAQVRRVRAYLGLAA